MFVRERNQKVISQMTALLEPNGQRTRLDNDSVSYYEKLKGG